MSLGFSCRIPDEFSSERSSCESASCCDDQRASGGGGAVPSGWGVGCVVAGWDLGDGARKSSPGALCGYPGACTRRVACPDRSILENWCDLSRPGAEVNFEPNVGSECSGFKLTMVQCARGHTIHHHFERRGAGRRGAGVGCTPVLMDVNQVIVEEVVDLSQGIG